MTCRGFESCRPDGNVRLTRHYSERPRNVEPVALEAGTGHWLGVMAHFALGTGPMMVRSGQPGAPNGPQDLAGSCSETLDADPRVCVASVLRPLRAGRWWHMPEGAIPEATDVDDVTVRTRSSHHGSAHGLTSLGVRDLTDPPKSGSADLAALHAWAADELAFVTRFGLDQVEHETGTAPQPPRRPPAKCAPGHGGPGSWSLERGRLQPDIWAAWHAAHPTT